ncbi:MAG TPA: DASS family sodium-coupled anion symporter [Puia sp.]|nr:DASS family sodium-coupled anion symporter [Puia sp.]
MDNETTNNTGPQKKEFRPWRNAVFFFGSMLIAFLLTRIVGNPAFTQSQDYVLFLLFFAIGLWITEAIPPFAVGLFIMAYLFFALGNANFNAAPVNPARYVQTFSSSIIWLLLSGFFLAEAMTKTGIDVYLFRFALRLSGKKPANIMLGVMLMTMTASMILSNTATTSMVIASMMPLIRNLGKNTFSKALLVGVPIAASVGGMGTIIGSPTNAIAVGELENNGITIHFLNWMFFGIPLAFILTMAGWWLLKRKYISDNAPIEMQFTSEDKTNGTQIRNQRIIVIAVLLITSILWMTSSLHHLTASSVGAVPLVFLTMTGILKSADIRKIPWDTLLLIAGALSLGLALQDTKLLEHFANHILGSPSGTKISFLVFAYVTMLFGNIMSHTATATMLIPLGVYLMPGHAEQIAVIIGLAASTSLLLPVSTPPNAIAYSTGLIKQKEFLPGGLLIGLLGPLLIVLFVLMIL